MHDIDAIKKMNGEYPAEDIHLHKVRDPDGSLSPLSIRYPMNLVTEWMKKADLYDAYVKELRSEPLRKNQ